MFINALKTVFKCYTFYMVSIKLRMHVFLTPGAHCLFPTFFHTHQCAPTEVDFKSPLQSRGCTQVIMESSIPYLSCIPVNVIP